MLLPILIDYHPLHPIPIELNSVHTQTHTKKKKKKKGTKNLLLQVKKGKYYTITFFIYKQGRKEDGQTQEQERERLTDIKWKDRKERFFCFFCFFFPVCSR